MSILSRRCPFSGFPHQAIDAGALTLLRDAAQSAEIGKYTSLLLLTLECFLQVTQQRLSSLSFSHRSFDALHACFVGALNSDEFNSFSLHNRYLLTLRWHRVVTALRSAVGMPDVAQIRIATQGGPELMELSIKAYSALPISDEHAWLWRAWPVTSRSGRANHLPLFPVYARLGREFTESLFQACAARISSQRCRNIEGLPQFTQFIDEHDETLTREALQDSEFVEGFLRRFCVYYFTAKYDHGRGASIKVTKYGWVNGFLLFFKLHLEGTAMFGRVKGSYPVPAVPRSWTDATHIRSSADGQQIKVKLLTHVPLHLTDQEAMQILFVNIERDINAVEKWAESRVTDLRARLEKRKVEAVGGEPWPDDGNYIPKDYAWKLNCSDQEYRSRTAATFEKKGFLAATDENLQKLYPAGRALIARYLALPTSGELLPHCALLVLRHPTITTAFLETLELYDGNGQMVGYTKLDGGPTLIGYKRRKGAKKARQTVSLTEETNVLVQELIELTEPLRLYLKRKGSDDWRYLLLSSGRGFGTPVRWRGISEATVLPNRKSALVAQLVESAGLEPSAASALLDRFSLDSLRASAGVREYLRTRSVQAMAEILGHDKFKPGLLSRYLPEPIIRFFQERWVRIFQNAFLLEIMKDSPLLPAVTDLKDSSEITLFILNHALRLPPEDLEDQKAPETQEDCARLSSQIVFGVNHDLFVLLLDRQRRGLSEQINRSAEDIYLDGISHHLIEYIDNEMQDREDIQHELMLARQTLAMI